MGNIDIQKVKASLSDASNALESENRKRKQVFQDIADSTSNIESDVSDIRTEIIKLNQDVALLKKKLAKERKRAEKAEEKAKTDAQWFSFGLTVFSVLLSNILPRIIAWIQSL